MPKQVLLLQTILKLCAYVHEKESSTKNCVWRAPDLWRIYKTDANLRGWSTDNDVTKTILKGVYHLDQWQMRGVNLPESISDKAWTLLDINDQYSLGNSYKPESHLPKQFK